VISDRYGFILKAGCKEFDHRIQPSPGLHVCRISCDLAIACDLAIESVSITNYHYPNSAVTVFKEQMHSGLNYTFMTESKIQK